MHDPSEQVVSISLATLEKGMNMVLSITGAAAQQLAAWIAAVLNGTVRTKGKAHLQTLLKSGKKVAAFSVKREELELFTKLAKRYGIIYTVVKDKTLNDPTIDVLTYAENAPRINHIIEKYGLSTVKQSAQLTNSRYKSREDRPAENMQSVDKVNKESSIKSTPAEKANADFLNQMQDNMIEPQKAQQSHSENPTIAAISSQSERIYAHTENGGDTDSRPSVRGALKDIAREHQHDRPLESPELQEPQSRTPAGRMTSTTSGKNTVSSIGMTKAKAKNKPKTR